MYVSRLVITINNTLMSLLLLAGCVYCQSPAPAGDKHPPQSFPSPSPPPPTTKPTSERKALEHNLERASDQLDYIQRYIGNGPKKP